MPDTIAILRGLKEKYEVHHGIRIRDAALVAAARLSSRYIADRFLPDKAIDLVDEAASRLRMEIDSLPTPIDTLQRKIISLEIERQALSRESDKASKERLKEVSREVSDFQEQASAMKVQWQREKELIGKIRAAKEEIERGKTDADLAQRHGDLNRAAELRYGILPNLELKLAEANNALESAKTGGQSFLREEVTEEDVAAMVAKWTGIPVEKMLEGELSRLSKMEERLHTRVIGQEEAVTAVANAVRRARAGLQDPQRPIGSFIFLGPTGVGKTELARSLADFLFDDESHMIRLDMGEYMEKHTVARLVGARPGYVGYEEGGQLTEAVRRKPYSVVLFDEIEKAHADVFNTLLQVLDDGRLTDGRGRTVDFKNTVVIMTSNVGSQFIRDVDDVERPDVKEQIDQALRAQFKPEFLNRIDDIIVFHKLGPAELRVIVDVQLARFAKRLAERNLTLELSPEAIALLCERGYDPAYGARPLKRTIQRYLQDPLAKRIIAGEFVAGDRIRGDKAADGNDEIVFGKVLFASSEKPSEAACADTTMATKNYYEVIGVPETAKADEIKKAYRKLAKRYHPDVTGGDKAKEAKFKELTEAYEVLGDEKKREEYDHARKNPFAGRGRPGAGAGAYGGDVDLNDLFSRFGQQQGGGQGGAGGFSDIFEMFGGGAPGGGRGRSRGPMRGQDVRARLEVDLPDAALGAERDIVIDGKHLKVRIPAGVTDGKTIRLAGQGEPGIGKGAPAGDLLLEVAERPHAQFKRIQPGGADIEVTFPVPVDVAILGGKAEVPTLEGNSVSLTIPAGTSSGRRMRLRGKGSTVIDHDGKKSRGDLYAVPSLQIPTDLSPKAKELLAEFARAVGKVKQEAE